MAKSLEQQSSQVVVTIEIPRWSFVKYAVTENGGRVDFISPLPCPFNYGFVEGLVGGDKQSQDAIVIGPRIRRASKVSVRVRATIRFVDNGETDDKFVCSAKPLSWFQVSLLRCGFHVYVIMKRIVNWSRGKNRSTRYRGIEFKDDERRERPGASRR